MTEKDLEKIDQFIERYNKLPKDAELKYKLIRGEATDEDKKLAENLLDEIDNLFIELVAFLKVKFGHGNNYIKISNSIDFDTEIAGIKLTTIDKTAINRSWTNGMSRLKNLLLNIKAEIRERLDSQQDETYYLKNSEKMKGSSYRNGVFISYSHKDKEWLDKLQIALKPLIRGEKVTIWDDTKILPGTDWKKEITNAIERSRIAILLVSPNFLASDFIYDQELPRIFKEYKNGDLIVYWLAVSASSYQMTELAQVQAVNDPSRPLDSQTASEQNKTFADIAKHVAKGMDVNVISNALSIIDEFLPRQKAFIDKVEFDDRKQDYSVQAKQEQEKINLVGRDNFVREVITADEIEKLDSGSKQLIRSYERTMKDLFDRWTELQPKSYSRDEYVKEEARAEMSKIRTDLCGQLNSILDFLRSLGKNLEDHYHHVRFICTQ